MSGFRFVTAVGAVQPREVIQVPVVAGQYESGRHSDRLCSASAPARVDIADHVRLDGVPQQFEETGVGSA
ncbi:MAG: hypothetical protein ACRDUW_28615, partial [Pseudonocardiaceae bacterium]